MPETLRVKWERCPFNPTSLPLIEGLSGVYVIWDPKTVEIVYIGKGDLTVCINEHLQDEEVSFYASPLVAEVRYAIIAEEKQAGVEYFLIETYEPRFGEKEPNCKEWIRTIPLPLKAEEYRLPHRN